MTPAVPTATTMAEIVTAIGQIVGGAVDWMGDYLSVLYSNPIMLFWVILGVVGLGIGLIRRMIRL